MTEKKIRYHAFIDNEYKYHSTVTPQNFSYNIEGFLPISENLNFIVNIEYVQIYHNTSTDDETYIPYYSYSYNVMIDFFKQNNILSNDQYINMYCGNTVDYKKVQIGMRQRIQLIMIILRVYLLYSVEMGLNFIFINLNL